MSNTTQPHSLVVGGSRGLGLAMARSFLAKGHKVGVISRTAPSDQGLHHFKTDLADAMQVAATLAAIKATDGPLDNLVFVQRYRGDGETWTAEIEASLAATKTLIEGLADKFAPGGSIVIVTSVVDRFVADEQPAGYHIAKAGLAHMARYYAVTLGPRGIRCNCVSPGVFVKEESRAFHEEGNRPLFYKQVIPLGRPGETGEICDVIAFLCTSAAAYVTGQNITVDGGVSAQAHLTLASKVFPGFS